MIDCSLNNRGLILGRGLGGGMLELVLTDCASRLIDIGESGQGVKLTLHFHLVLR